jgi:undecaprenyl-diphosphatase
VDIALLVKAALMGVVEGLTEFLPVSSTGHLILAGALLGFDDAKAKVFDIAIQTGAILAVIIVYWQKIRSTLVALPTEAQARRFALNVFIAFVPAVILGLLFGKAIKAHLFTPVVVASTFIIGGFIILWAEKRQQVAVRIHDVDEMTALDAIKVGLVQCLAMVPGTSRSGATIIGGMLLGLSRKAATDFSFYLAIPTLVGRAPTACTRSAPSCPRPTCRCLAWGCCFRSSAPGCACAGCCATSPPTASCRLPGTASRLAWWCWPPPGAGW